MIPDIDRAIRFAANAHQGQVRDGDGALPYICHPVDVLQRLHVIGRVRDPIILCAGVLHDVLEETPVTVVDIKREFGDDVARLVGQVTREEPTLDAIAGLTKDEIWQLRTNLLLHEISVLMGPEAHQIKLADRLSNLEEAIRTRTPKKVARYQKQTRMILDIIPSSVNPALHAAVETVLASSLKRP